MLEKNWQLQTHEFIKQREEIKNLSKEKRNSQALSIFDYEIRTHVKLI